MTVELNNGHPEDFIVLPENYSPTLALADAEAMFIRLETLLLLLYHDGLEGANSNNFNISERRVINAFSQCLTHVRFGLKIIERAKGGTK